MRRYIDIGGRLFDIESDDIYLDGMDSVFEPNMVKLFSILLDSEDIVADIGANIGMTTLLFSQLAKKVFSFEPSPSTFELLQKNVGRAQLDNVELVNVGFGVENSSQKITFARNNRSGGFVSRNMVLSNGYVTENISILSFDHMFANNKEKPTFLKIDVEGFERDVIYGGMRHIATMKPTVVMEMNHFCLNVLQRITLPDFIESMISVFPFIYAIDNDNGDVVDLNDPQEAYEVMYQHVVHGRFPNIVGGFDNRISYKLRKLESSARLLREKKECDTPPVKDHSGILEIIGGPESVLCGEVFFVEVNVRNHSNFIWQTYGRSPINASYHWRHDNGSDEVFDGTRTPIECDFISPSESVKITVKVIAPEIAGHFDLILTLVQESVSWFEMRGFLPATASIRVDSYSPAGQSSKSTGL